jgi:general secretion pathway protein G
MAMRRRRQAGLTLVELIVAFTILALLTTMAVPMAKYKVRRDKERELRHALLEMRTAVDKYKDLCDNKQLDNTVAGKIGSECYPETLEALVQGVKKTGAVDQKFKFLRRVPRDPFTNSREWGKRSVQDETSSTSWGGQNIFDVFTKSTEKAPDGTPYAEW